MLKTSANTNLGGTNVNSVTGTANEVTVTPTTGAAVVSLPSAITLTGKTMTGGAFTGATYQGAIGGVTPAAGAFTTISASTPIPATSVATMSATVGGGVPTPPNNTTTFLRGDGTFAAPSASGVTSITGTANQITASAATGAVTLSIPNSPVFTTPNIGAATGTSIALGGGTALSTYSSGTWTPGISFGGGTTGITYGVQAGHYVKIGKLVTLMAAIVLTSKGSSTGAAKVTGLPYTITTGSDQYSVLAPVSIGTGTITLVALTPYVSSFNTGSATTLDVMSKSSTGSDATIADAAFTDTAQLYFTVSYIATVE